ncbi:MAG: hypothetical protein K6A79_02010 [Ruminococcus sp.]|nr:hypothetical protein [Ruminococcus sp.]
MSGKPGNNRLNKAFTIAALIIAGVFTLLFLVLFILTGQGVLRLGLCLPWLIILVIMLIKGAEKHSCGWSIAGIIIKTPVLLIMSMMFIGVSSAKPWQYSYQRAYIHYYRSWYKEVLPQELPKDIDDYVFSYLPTFGQGGGHDSVRFSAPTETIEVYEKEYASQAIYTIPLSDFKDSYIYYVKDISPKAEQGLDEYPNNTLHIYYDNKFWNDTDATVYVISAVHDFNHPSSYSVIISQDHTKIQFAKQFG